jgi:acid phosphatase (class A)
MAGSDKPAAVPEFRPGLLVGYLPPAELPNSLTLLPPPPATGSAAFVLDEEIARGSATWQGTSRWALAISDADLRFPHAAGTFSCALNLPITEEHTPYLYQLLRRTLTDVGLSTYAAKNHYQRERPFMANMGPICTPDERAGLEKDGSYPSGHTAIGWAWALILTEIAPDQADTLLARGAVFGDSRSVCNVHWHSDVTQGRIMGAATVARLHADPAFRADLKRARKELEAARAKGAMPARNCADEAKAMSGD